jgi:tetratricopeptide (TPR) repeat protein
MEQCIRVGRQALAMAEALGLEGLRARALTYVGSARLMGGDPGGQEDLERAAAIAVEANSPESVLAYGNLADRVIALGDLERGFELQTKAREAAERFGLASDLRWLQVERVHEDYWRGRWDAALVGAEEFLAEAEAGSPHFGERACRHIRGLIRLARGDPSGALDDATSAVELATRIREPQAVLPTFAFHTHALLANGRTQQAAARASELLAALAEHGAIPTSPDWSGALAIVLHALGRGGELVELVAGIASPTRWLQAATAIAAGELELAADRYAEIGSRPDEAYARLLAAERLLVAGRPADAQLAAAVAFYREVGAVAHLRQAEALLGASA